MRPIRVAALLILCASMATSACAARRARAAGLDEGLALYQKADFAAALKAFDGVAKSTTAPKPDRARGYQYAALMHVAMGKAHYAQAQKDIETMVQLNPRSRPDPEEFPEAYMKLYYKAATATHSFADAPRPGVTTVAIMDFENTSIGDDAEKYGALGRGLSQMLITDLLPVSGLRLVEREKIQYVLDELKLQRSGEVDPATAARVGKMVGAQALLFGGAMVNDKELVVSWRLVKVETGEIIKAGKEEGEARKIADLEKKLALGLAENMKVTVDPNVEKKIESTERPSLDATLAYSEGLKHLDEGNTQSACEKFQQAAKLDPKFAAAQRRLTKLKPLAQAS